MGDFAEFNDDEVSGWDCPPWGRVSYLCEKTYALLEKPWGFQRNKSSQKHYLLEKLGVNNLLGEKET